MPIYLKQSTASQEVPLGYFVDAADGNTERTALTIANTDIKLWKAGATTLANKNSGGATHISNGIYYAVLDATDTNTLGPMVGFCHPTSCLAVRVEFVVLAANIYDSLIGGGDVLDVSTTQWNGTAVGSTQVRANIVQVDNAAIASTSVAGVMKVDISHAAGTAWASGAITAASIATDAIDSDALASSAIAEIQAGLASPGMAMTLSAAERNSIADAFLDRDMSTGTDSGSPTVRTPRQALRTLRNKVANSAGTLTVYKEDDSTSSWTATVTTDASAEPITTVDPA